MTEFTFITANDIHISDSGPRSRIDDFKKSILNKISQAGKAANKLGADAFLIAGDLYNLKQPARNSHRLNQELIEEFQKFNCPIYMIPGNHDLTANNLNSLSDQPLGVLFADNTLKKLDHLVLEKEGKKVSLVGIPYMEDLNIGTLTIPEKGDCICQICLMHIYAGPNKGMLFKERLYGYDELKGLGPDIFVLGHYHMDQGIQEVDGISFINIGSIARGTLTEENIEHSPQIGFIKISVDDKGNVSKMLRTLKLKVLPAIEIFDLKKREEEQKENEKMQEFIEKLMTETSIGNIEKHNTYEDMVQSMDIEKTVRDRVVNFLQAAQL